MLLAVAILPVAAGNWYHSNLNKAAVSVGLGALTLAYLFIAYGETAAHPTLQVAGDYVRFIILLLALYVVAGGIHLGGNLVASPWTNVGFLAVGSILASVIGTMGASMVLIRPLLRTNIERVHRRHTIIFFIFCVANVGGLLTPLGDPPLFLGFLRGVPFSWSFHLWPQWLATVALLLATYAAIEKRHYRREPPSARELDTEDYVPMSLIGRVNLVLLGVIILVVVISSPLERMGQAIHFPFLRELLLLAVAAISLRLSPRKARESNKFTWSPIVEVAVIFAGIFATMIPAIEILKSRGAGLGLTKAWEYFWATGSLSGFLDNAPTYLTFATAAQNQVGAHSLGGLTTTVASASGVVPAALLAAVSSGAVMMGALSYVGNAPNMVIRSVAEEAGVGMPSFLGYIRYSLMVLIPVFVVITLVFFI